VIFEITPKPAIYSEIETKY